MPRIYDSTNDPHDYCRKHMPGEASPAAVALQFKGDGPDGRGNCYGWDAEHPPYGGDYVCEVCKGPLTELDD